MKFVTWIIVLSTTFTIGFFLGRYYEANRELDIEDVADFQERIGEQAEDLQDEFKASLKDKLNKLLD